MFAAEHTDIDLEAFLVLSKRLGTLTLYIVHVPSIGITCSHICVVAAVPCNKTIQGHLVHAQRLARLHADKLKEHPCLYAHVPYIHEHSTVCTSATLPSVTATAATSKARPGHRQDTQFERTCYNCTDLARITTPDEKRRRFLVAKLEQLRCEHSCQRGHQHGPLRLGRKPVAHYELCHGVHRRAARVVDRHQRVRLQQDYGLLLVGAQQVERNSLGVQQRQLAQRLPRVLRVRLVRLQEGVEQQLHHVGKALGILLRRPPALGTFAACAPEGVEIHGRRRRLVAACALSRQRHGERKALQVPHERQNTLGVALPLQHLALHPTACLLLGKTTHVQPDDVGDAPPVCYHLPAQGLVRLPCFLLT
mmetsp:Transcript_41683/g.61274  ORF Transcript_41683/g.61274 Transcript_41683/m.61274 type:complete len:364 (-) Transcript_41683:561-1652(-)